MVDSGTMGCPEQESAGCHFGTLGEKLLRAKNKMAAGDFVAGHKYHITSLLLVLES